jgi:hypothetical protein
LGQLRLIGLCEIVRRRWRFGLFLVVLGDYLDGPAGQRVATPGDLLTIVPVNLQRNGIGPNNSPLDAIVRAANAATDLERL